MCAFCGGLVRERHWSDRLELSDAGTDGAASWRQSRQVQVALVNQILRPYGLEVRDWNAHVFVLSNRTGQSEVVPSLGAVWNTAERLGQCRCDPLDPAMLAMVDAADGLERELPDGS